MSLREKIEERIRSLLDEQSGLVEAADRQRDKLRQAELALNENRALVTELQALVGSDEPAPRPQRAPRARRQTSATPDSEKPLRAGTKLDQVRQILEAEGKAVHIDDILRLMGEPESRSAKVSLVGSLSRCVQDKRVFVRTAPNVYGLIGRDDEANANEVIDPAPPPPLPNQPDWLK